MLNPIKIRDLYFQYIGNGFFDIYAFNKAIPENCQYITSVLYYLEHENYILGSDIPIGHHIGELDEIDAMQEFFQGLIRLK